MAGIWQSDLRRNDLYICTTNGNHRISHWNICVLFFLFAGIGSTVFQTNGASQPLADDEILLPHRNSGRNTGAYWMGRKPLVIAATRAYMATKCNSGRNLCHYVLYCSPLYSARSAYKKQRPGIGSEDDTSAQGQSLLQKRDRNINMNASPINIVTCDRRKKCRIPGIQRCTIDKGDVSGAGMGGYLPLTENSYGFLYSVSRGHGVCVA